MSESIGGPQQQGSSTRPSQALAPGLLFPSGILYHYLVVEQKRGNLEPLVFDLCKLWE